MCQVGYTHPKMESSIIIIYGDRQAGVESSSNKSDKPDNEMSK